MFVVKCAKCGKRSKAFVDHAGMRGKCPHCKKKIPIVAAEGEIPGEVDEVIQPLAGSVRRERAERARLPDTSPPGLLTFGLALAATSAFFSWAGERLPGTSLAGAWDILLSCDWIGKVEILLFFWGSLLLGFKILFWWWQRRSLKWKVLPEPFEGETKVRPADIETCLTHLQGLTLSIRSRFLKRACRFLEYVNLATRSILLNRVRIALEHLRLTRDVQQVRGALTGQSAIDANLLDSSYTILRFLVWVIPISGFIGTVIGIGMAVGEFANFMPDVAELEEAMAQLRTGLGAVTSGLSTAFNSTLVGLCLVAPLMLMTSSLRKMEEHLLAEIDQYSNHQLLASLTDSDAEYGPRPVNRAASLAQASKTDALVM